MYIARTGDLKMTVLGLMAQGNVRIDEPRGFSKLVGSYRGDNHTFTFVLDLMCYVHIYICVCYRARTT